MDGVGKSGKGSVTPSLRQEAGRQREGPPVPGIFLALFSWTRLGKCVPAESEIPNSWQSGLQSLTSSLELVQPEQAPATRWRREAARMGGGVAVGSSPGRTAFSL